MLHLPSLRRGLILFAGAVAFAGQLRCEADVVLVPRGATWRYLDDGSNQGSAWRSADFADSTWREGVAEIGYGDGDETTVLAPDADPNARPFTTYFRRTFEVPNPAAFSKLKLRLLRDDGALVFLNGRLLRRDNMRPGPVGYRTSARSNVEPPREDTYFEKLLPAKRLLAGLNTLAVEVHQSRRRDDLSFDLELIGIEPATAPVQVTRGPYLQQATPTSLIVRWRTNVPTRSAVRFGTSAAAVTQVVTAPAVVTEHEVQLTGLEPRTQYFYEIAHSTGAGEVPLKAGSEFTFFTPPPVGTAQPARIWVIGDSGTADRRARAVRNAYVAHAGERYTDVWLMLGDNAYPRGSDVEYQRAVFEMYPAMLRTTPLWSTLGNHETYTPGTPYFGIFSFPKFGEAGGVPSGTESYYSFDYANIHFVCLDSMVSDRSVGGPMHQWLMQDLQQNTQKWLIAFWHHPPYSKGSHDSDAETELVQMRTNFVPVLEEHGVDLVLAGHSHSYERSVLLNGHYGLSTNLTPAMKVDARSGQEGEGGPYVKDGSAGGNKGAVYVVEGTSGQVSGGTYDHPAMFRSLPRLGSVVLDIDGDFLRAKFLRENGRIDDEFAIQKVATPLRSPE